MAGVSALKSPKPSAGCPGHPPGERLEGCSDRRRRGDLEQEFECSLAGSHILVSHGGGEAGDQEPRVSAETGSYQVDLRAAGVPRCPP